METKEEKKVNFEMAAIISIISVLMVGVKATSQGSKFDLLEYHIKDDDLWKNNFKVHHYLKISRGAYNNWVRRVFWSDAPECQEIRQVCEKVAASMSKEFTALKNEISQYMIEDDCVMTESIAYTCAICSMLHLAVDLCDLCAKQYDEYSQKWTRLKSIAPRQMFQNVRNIYEGLPMPNDLDVTESEKINKAMKILGEKMYMNYLTNFTVPKSDVA